MRRLVVIEFITLDGVMQGLGSPDEDRDGGFSHGGWGRPYAEAVHESVADGPMLTTGYLLGRRTYEKMAAFWPHQPPENAMAHHLNTTPKHVASRTLTDLEWEGARVIGGDLGQAVLALKDEGVGDLAVLGSGELVQQLMLLDVVDELRLFVHPLLLGTGKRLFRELPEPRRLRLRSSSATSAGSLVLAYDVLPPGEG